MRRILLALSLVVSTPLAFADLIDTSSNAANSTDRLGELSRTLSHGSYSTEANDVDEGEDAPQVNVTLRGHKSVEFNNASIAKKYGTSNLSVSNTGSSSGVMSWLKANPLPGMVRVSSQYGTRVFGGKSEYHPGVDLAAPSGTPIYASGSGVVTRSGWVNGYGQMIEINHGNGYITRYAHASRLLVSVGEHVQAGEEIAKVGCTGRCTGAHLHYEIVQDGQRKNPSTYLAMLP
ncbi:M23 family metallopeptidase [Acinetobacter sp. MB5]|uniref:M23 family metallopeptidase n=1 Tax=Acinetobacter sp. MB5 TaxID=2069438 RepID=UPI000DD07F1C|nr:M23 family metallopeptidase [Acinetobacter sp. MB5]